MKVIRIILAVLVVGLLAAPASMAQTANNSNGGVTGGPVPMKMKGKQTVWIKTKDGKVKVLHVKPGHKFKIAAGYNSGNSVGCAVNGTGTSWNNADYVNIAGGIACTHPFTGFYLTIYLTQPVPYAMKTAVIWKNNIWRESASYQHTFTGCRGGYGTRYFQEDVYFFLGTGATVHVRSTWARV